MKTNRHNAILKIITENDIETQTELSDALLAEGFHVTQATISRDIKDLRLVKVQNDQGKTIYTVHSANLLDVDLGSRLKSIIAKTVISVHYAENLVVLKTIPGAAQASAAAFDAMKMSEVLGTIAGDDTVLIIAQKKESAGLICEKIKKIMRN